MLYFSFNGSRAVLSGPAGGVVGYAMTAYDGTLPVIGFDMGGTSTDVSRYAGSYEHVFESTAAGITIQAPQVRKSYLDIAEEAKYFLPPQTSRGNYFELRKTTRHLV